MSPFSDFAIWWKSLFFTPFWAGPLLLVLGAVIRDLPVDVQSAFIAFIFVYFFLQYVNDLRKRELIIHDNFLYYGFHRYDLSKLASMTNLFLNFGLPTNAVRLMFNDETSSKLTIRLRDMSPEDAELLIETIAKRYKQVDIDPDVERTIRSLKPLHVMRIPNPDELVLNYRPHVALSELPKNFIAMTRQMANKIGPVGLFLVSTPFWLAFNLGIIFALRHYENVRENATFYLILAGCLKWLESLYPALENLSLLSVKWGLDPSLIVPLVLTVIVLIAMLRLDRILLKPNRLTINRAGVSLDIWGNLISHEAASVKWADVAEVSISGAEKSSDPETWKLRFTRKDRKTLDIDLCALDRRERETLLSTIQNFAPPDTLKLDVLETLMSRHSNSYTELWLQSLSDAPSRKNLEPLKSGTRLKDRYEVSRRLGIGGEGTAYQAADLSNLGYLEQVVLKETIVPPYMDTDAEKKTIERLEREARILGSLKSELIVELKDFFIEDRRCYMVLEYIKGKNLRKFIAEDGCAEEDEVIELALKMCDILSVLHQQSVVHRDFTPDNLIFERESNTLKLIDFALATEYESGTTGTVVGKHSYIPPEQFRGHATTQSDIYALGATIYYLLKGSDPEPITQAAPETVSALGQVVAKCTALDLAERYKNVEEITADLLRLKETSESLTIKLRTAEEVENGRA